MCPCGSEKRFNKCHGKGLPAQSLAAVFEATKPFKYDHSRGEEQLIGQTFIYGVVERVITSGGMASIYVIRRENGKVIALKTLPRERYKDIVLKQRFEREAKLWLLIPWHPNVLSAEKYFTVMGRPFICMNYFERGDLAKLASQKRLWDDPELCQRFALQICEAMIHVTGHGIASHGDLKPQNCLVADDGNTLRLGDFGLARSTQDLSQGRHDDIWQSPSFAAPEVKLRAEFGLSSDIFSFGILLYWMRWGRIPSRKPDGTPLIPAEHRELSPEVFQIVSSCCALDPKDRPGDFSAVKSMLLAQFPFLGTTEPQNEQGSVFRYFQYSSVAEDLLALDDGQLAVKACDLALQDPIFSSIPPAVAGILRSKALGLFLGRDFPAVRNICNRLLGPEFQNCFDAEFRSNVESLNRLAARPAHEIGASGFTGMKPTAASAERDRLDGMAHELVLSGHYLEALRLSNEIDTRFGSSDATTITMANALFKLGKWPQARKAYQQAIQMNPHNYTAYYCLAIASFESGEWEQALYNLEFSIEISPHNPFAWAAKARLLASQNAPSHEIVHCFDKAIALDPYNTKLREERELHTHLSEVQ